MGYVIFYDFVVVDNVTTNLSQMLQVKSSSLNVSSRASVNLSLVLP
jgi:hypothetical protein